MDRILRDSYWHCEQVSRQAASSFYWSFSRLPAEKRASMFALYAFARRTDDLADSELPLNQRRDSLAAWRSELAAALEGHPPHGCWAAVADTVERFAIPEQYLYAIIDGVGMDLTPVAYESFEQLRQYCYHVASAVGLACIHIWGFSDQRALVLAESCGTAFQMTNILRDLREDAQRGRIYLPQEDLDRFGYRRDDLLRLIRDDRLQALLQFEVERTRALYDHSAALVEYLSPETQRAFTLMFATYRSLLDQIGRRGSRVLDRPVGLSRFSKMRLVALAMLPKTSLLRAVFSQSAAQITDVVEPAVPRRQPPAPSAQRGTG